MKSIHSLRTYIVYLILVVFLIQIFLLLYLIIEYEHSQKNSEALFLPAESRDKEKSSPFKPNSIQDLETIHYIMGKYLANIFLIHKDILQQVHKHNLNFLISTLDSKLTTSVSLAVNYQTISQTFTELIEEFQDNQFDVTGFFNENPRVYNPSLDSVPVALILKRYQVFQVIIFHSRKGLCWWFGSIKSDKKWIVKVSKLKTSFATFNIHEGALEKFETVALTIGSFRTLIPKHIDQFLRDVQTSKFIECDYERARSFVAKYKISIDSRFKKFQHKVYKILNLLTIVARTLSIPFWLSSGTCLGYFRQCDVIPYTTDIDVGIFIDDYKPEFETALESHGLRLKHKLGLLNDSYEISFFLESDASLKLDVFFFYKEKDFYWNGGTQVKTGRKFQYKFPKFHLCWTIFLDLKVRVPCETESYIFANYGPNWTKPIKNWDWKSSPNNVYPAGVWTQQQIKKAIQIF